MEKRIHYHTYHFEDRSDRKLFHHFILQEEKNNLILRYMDEDETEERTVEDMTKITFPMQHIPKFAELITKVFYCNKLEGTYLEEKFDDIAIFAYISIDERIGDITEVSFGYKTGKDSDRASANLKWPGKKFPLLEASTRIMPESLAWLLDNLKKFYNEWQKDHTEHQQME